MLLMHLSLVSDSIACQDKATSSSAAIKQLLDFSASVNAPGRKILKTTQTDGLAQESKSSD